MSAEAFRNMVFPAYVNVPPRDSIDNNALLKCSLCNSSGGYIQLKSGKHSSAERRAIRLLLIRAAWKVVLLLLNHTSQVLVHSEGNGLSRRDSHHARGDTLIETRNTFRLPHISCDFRDASKRGVASLSWGLLQACLDRVDRSIRKRTHCAGDQADR